MEQLYSVTELAKPLDVTARALRFHEDKGLISPQRAGKTRVYTHRDRGRRTLSAWVSACARFATGSISTTRTRNRWRKRPDCAIRCVRASPPSKSSAPTSTPPWAS